MEINFAELDWHRVLPMLGVEPALIENPKRSGPCPIEGGGKTRFRFDNKAGRGTWICNHCGAGDGVSLVAKVNGTDVRGAIQLIRGAIGGTKHQPEFRRAKPVEPDVKTPQQIEKARDGLKRAWCKAKAIIDTPAQLYLQNRVVGLNLTWLASSFRFRDELFHFDSETAKKSRLPCLLSRVVDASSPSHVVTLHRTYLSSTGQKAGVSPDQVKKLMPATVEKIGGESIQLNTATGALVIVTEGIESGLAWVMACKNRYPVYAAISCGNLAKFKWPMGTKAILIASDHDAVNPKTGLRPGLHHAKILKERAVEAGIKAIIKIPDTQGIDWDDLWNQGDIGAFKLRRLKKSQAETQTV
jgi:putative DNA primase/helicase